MTNTNATPAAPVRMLTVEEANERLEWMKEEITKITGPHAFLSHLKAHNPTPVELEVWCEERAELRGEAYPTLHAAAFCAGERFMEHYETMRAINQAKRAEKARTTPRTNRAKERALSLRSDLRSYQGR